MALIKSSLKPKNPNKTLSISLLSESNMHLVLIDLSLMEQIEVKESCSLPCLIVKIIAEW